MDPQESQEDKVVDFLLPSGILIPLPCAALESLEDIKDKLWKEAQAFPLFGLKSPEWYTLVFVNCKAEQEECLDEAQRLCDVKMYKPLFKVVEKKGNQDEKMLSTKIAWLLGKGSLKDFETVREAEVNDFRATMIESCRTAIEQRNGFSWEQKVLYHYPPDIESSAEISQLVADRLSPQNTFTVSIHTSTVTSNTSSDEQRDLRYVLSASPHEKVPSLLEKAVRRFNRALGPDKEPAEPKDYILKVCGMDEYLLGDYPLIQFKCIKRAVSKGSNALLTLVPKSSVYMEYLPETFHLPSTLPKRDRAKKRGVSLWDMVGKFQLKVMSAGNLNVSKDASIQVYAGVFHGTEEVCQVGNTRPIQTQDSAEASVWHWNEHIAFDIEVRDLPRGARLCLSIWAVYGSSKKNKKKAKENAAKEKVPLAWVNQPLFDYCGQLVNGNSTLPCWAVSPEEPLEELLNPIGTVMLNPNTQDSPSINIQFKDYSKMPISYPDLDVVLEVASKEIDLSSYNQSVPKTYEQELKEIVARDPLAPLFEQDKELIWRFRVHLLESTPSSLPKLLNSVKWNQHKDVAVLESIMGAWRPLPPEEALELLDYAYQDPNVRAYAVRCLQNMSDTEMSQYLLQLCQVLKYESHLDCPLIKFLLDRAWRNKRIGHYLFWHLRSELDSPEVTMRFGLILEAYLRGSPNHIAELQRQVDGMAKMRNISELLQTRQFKDRDKRNQARDAMRQLLSQHAYRQVMCNCTSILNPKLKLGDMRVPECKFYDSKMRPLLLAYDNPDPSSLLQDIRIMFKCGDDLRQDMLTLQIINIMDSIWQQEGLDLRLIPYGALSTGNRVGFIELVRKSETIANIQKNKKEAQRSRLSLWDSSLLYSWLKEKNPTEPQLQKAAEAFSLSCAGYCVATYVLGIGDRHSDNIMVTEGGQLFHVDFGHFLGNFKVKFGVRRERVPFVLAHDFEIIIEKHFGFDKFVQLCEDAYMILRRRAALFVNLLAMMVQTGIPELRSIEDLNYVRDALILGVSEKEAKDHFHSKLHEARKNAKYTVMNWFLHGIAKDNR